MQKICVNSCLLYTSDELEYRKQFMAYMLKGTPITMRNESATTTTTDVGAVIPNTIMNKIVEKVEQSGNILAKITRRCV